MEAVLAALFVGGAWWAWAKYEKAGNDSQRQREQEHRIIHEHHRGLTIEEITQLLGVRTEEARKTVDYWRFMRDDWEMTPAQREEWQKLKQQARLSSQ